MPSNAAGDDGVVEQLTANDLDPETRVYHAGRQGGKDTVLHLGKECRHIERSQSVFDSIAGVVDQDRPVCKECLGSAEFGGGEGIDVNRTRKQLLKTDPADLGLSPIGGRRR